MEITTTDNNQAALRRGHGVIINQSAATDAGVGLLIAT